MSDFILVKHDAIRRGLHWDLRWKEPTSKNWISFAFKKSPPTKAGERVYIVRTTQHSEEQALYLGQIPEGEYGAGTLTKEDFGKCDVLKYTNAHMIVVFHGKKLNGKYHVIATGVFGGKHDYTRKTYVFFKAKDTLSETFNKNKLWVESFSNIKKFSKIGTAAIIGISIYPMVSKIITHIIRSLSLCNRICEVVDKRGSDLTSEEKACVRRCKIGILNKGIRELSTLSTKCKDQKCKDKIESKIKTLKHKISEEREALTFLGAKKKLMRHKK